MNEKARLDKVAQILQGAIAKMRWRFGSSPPPRRGEKAPAANQLIVVEPVFAHKIHAEPHYGIGITRWEIWVRPDWLENVYEKGHWLFPDDEEMVLDAWEYELPACGFDASYKALTLGPEWYELRRRLCIRQRHIVVWAKAAALGNTASAAAARAMLVWERAIGVRRDDELPF
jgi:hypothetical protein